MVSKEDGELIALSLLTAGETLHSYSSFLPSAFTIKNWVLDGTPQQTEERIANLRSGYAPAFLMSELIAGAVGWAAHSWIPVVASTAASFVVMYLYEKAIPPDQRLTAAGMAAQVNPLRLGAGQQALPAATTAALPANVTIYTPSARRP